MSFPVIFIMTPCHMATEVSLLRDALLHQSEVPVAFDFEGIDGEGGGKELGLILGMAEGDTELDNIVIWIRESVALKLCLPEIHLVKLVGGCSDLLGANLEQSVILDLSQAIKSAVYITGDYLVDHRLGSCKYLGCVSGRKFGQENLLTSRLCLRFLT